MPIRTRRVAAAMAIKAIIASRYGVSDGQVALPSAANGYRDSITAGSTT